MHPNLLVCMYLFRVVVVFNVNEHEVTKKIEIR
jgi:hypothetical protein